MARRDPFYQVFGAAMGALLMMLVVALPAAVVYGHHGPDWPLVPMAINGAVGLVIGWRG